MTQPSLFSKESMKEAYDSSDKQSLDRYVLSLLKVKNLTAFDLADEMNWDITRARPCLSRLLKRHLVYVFGRVADNRSRTKVCVYKLEAE